MNDNKTDADWEFFGRDNPYWGVLTDDRFRNQNLNNATRNEFFSSGEEYINRIFATIQTYLDAHFAPKNALDFGCGVGRLLFPIAQRCHFALGVDVSDGMLGEAKAVCESRGVKNVSFVKSDDNLSELQDKFDFINSYIVFQHIPCVRGVRLFQRLANVLNEGGIGAIHVTYSTGDNTGSLDTILPLQYSSPDGFRHHLRGLGGAIKRRVRKILEKRRMNNLATVKESRSQSVLPHVDLQLPTMQMNSYVLNPLFHILQREGIRHLHLEFTDQNGAYGVTLLFQKPLNAPRPIR